MASLKRPDGGNVLWWLVVVVVAVVVVGCGHDLILSKLYVYATTLKNIIGNLVLRKLCAFYAALLQDWIRCHCCFDVQLSESSIACRWSNLTSHMYALVKVLLLWRHTCTQKHYMYMRMLARTCCSVVNTHQRAHTHIQSWPNKHTYTHTHIRMRTHLKSWRHTHARYAPLTCRWLPPSM